MEALELEENTLHQHLLDFETTERRGAQIRQEKAKAGEGALSVASSNRKSPHRATGKKKTGRLKAGAEALKAKEGISVSSGDRKSPAAGVSGGSRGPPLSLDPSETIGYHHPMTPMGLTRIRRRLGLTQEGLAKRIGVQRLAVTRWETGQRGISEPIARLIQRIAAEARGKKGRKA